VHGGLIMSLTDTLGSLAVASQGQYMTGVSTDISTSFVKPAGKPGDELKMTATLTAMGTYRMFIMEFQSCSAGRLSGRLSHSLFFFFSGKSLAYTRVDFTNPAGQLVAYGSGFSPFLVCCLLLR
jgi:acyl-coenzyme A thioesterase 13